MVVLPEPAGPASRTLVPRSGPPPSSASSSGTPLGTNSASNARWWSAREDVEPAGRDLEIVVAGDEIDPAQLLHLHAAACRAEIERQPLERQHAVAQAVQVPIAADLGPGHVVDQQHGGAAPGEELLERQHLPPVAERILGEQPHLRQAVEHHAGRAHPLHLVLDQADELAQLEFPGVENGLVTPATQHLGRGVELEHREIVERPAVGAGGKGQLLPGFGERYVEHRLATRRALAQEFKGERRLAGAGRALQQVEMAGRQPATQDRVQPAVAGGDDVGCHASPVPAVPAIADRIRGDSRTRRGYGSRGRRTAQGANEKSCVLMEGGAPGVNHWVSWMWLAVT